ncbi:hypothetical protein [Planobispora rosea]|uniref:hypothetical protein n=1 Tax=Planobispora rosea TaxID=35762 RepID=UPI00159F0D09|nr:hypothetical protein [Planobispora rosea]
MIFLRATTSARLAASAMCVSSGRPAAFSAERRPPMRRWMVLSALPVATRCSM